MLITRRPQKGRLSYYIQMVTEERLKEVIELQEKGIIDLRNELDFVIEQKDYERASELANHLSINIVATDLLRDVLNGRL